MSDKQKAKNPFQDTVQKAKNMQPRKKTALDKPEATQADQSNKPSYVNVHVCIDADLMAWVKQTAANNHWTQRTVFELALKNYMATLDD